MPGGEVIMLHIGQAGVQTSAAVWELFCLEHGIHPSGQMVCDYFNNGADRLAYNSIFQEHELNGTFVPRALLIDMEPSCIDEVRIGFYRRLFHPDMMISGKEDCANNFARGYYSYGREFDETICERVRHLVEPCAGMQGFMMFRSLGGGCGAGFGSLLLERLADYYGRKSKLTFDVFPSPRFSSAPVEPYNAILTTHSAIGCTDVSFIYDNEALYDICRGQLSISQPNFPNVNRVIAQVVSALTCSLRFEGSLNVDLTEFQTNLVPYPRIHFPLLCYAPMTSAEKAFHERCTVGSMLTSLFDPRSQMVKCDTRRGKFMACAFLFRGDVTPNDVNMAMGILRGNESSPGKVRFVDWSPTGFKVGLCNRAPFAVPGGDIALSPRAVVGMLNTTAIREPWKRLIHKYDVMFAKRAFVHWYVGEGMEEQEFSEARENLHTLAQDYADLENGNGTAYKNTRAVVKQRGKAAKDKFPKEAAPLDLRKRSK